MKNTVPKAHDEREKQMKTTCYLDPETHKAWMNHARKQGEPYTDKPSLYLAKLIQDELKERGEEGVEA